jgi:hypothetical protein
MSYWSERFCPGFSKVESKSWATFAILRCGFTTQTKVTLVGRWVLFNIRTEIKSLMNHWHETTLTSF